MDALSTLAASAAARRARGRLVAALALTGLLAAPARLPAASAPQPALPSQRLVFGVATLERPEAAAGAELTALRDYLDRAQAAGVRSPLRPIRLEVVAGSPYEILSWLEEGTIDGAVVSPLIRQLLVERRLDSGAKADLVKVATPTGGGRSGILRSYPPVGRARRCTADGPRPLDDVSGELDAALEALLASLGEQEPPAAVAPAPPAYRLLLPSHLSAAAWAVVLQHGRALLTDALAGADQALRQAYEGAFWRRLFATVDYTLGDERSCAEPAPGGGDAVEVELGDDGRTAGADGWRELPLALQGYPITVDDVVLVNPAAVEGVLPPEALDPAGRTSSESLFAALFLDASLRPVLADQLGWSASSGRRSFAFRVGEALRLIAHAQREEGCEKLALVLPGGGVRAAYQSVLVDRLYGTDGAPASGPLLVNRRADPTQCRPPAGGAMPVDYVVGNSGGALLGFFVSRLGDGDRRRLSDLLWHVGGQPLDSRDIFSPIDQMRWATALAVLAVFTSVVLVASRLWKRWPFRVEPAPPRDAGSRWALSLGMTAALVAIPLLLKLVNGRGALEHLPALEGLFYFGFLCLAMLADHCLVRSATSGRRPPASRLAAPLALLAGGLVLAGLPVALHFSAGGGAEWIERPFVFVGLWRRALIAAAPALLLAWGAVFFAARRSPARAARLDAVARPLLGAALGATAVAVVVSTDVWVGRGALLFCLGTTALLLGFVWLRSRWPSRYRLAGVHDFAQALALPVLVLTFTYLLVVPLAWMGEISWLELTPGLWVVLFCSSVLLTALLIALAAWTAHRGSAHCRWVRQGLTFLTSRHPAGDTGALRCVRLLLFFASGLLVWNLVNAPGLYGNEHARDYLDAAANRFEQQQPASQGVGFRTYFAVPANTLASARDRYFLFTPTSDDRIPVAVERDSRWWICRAPADREQVERVVFASGSPFPIFPPHFVAMPCAKEDDGKGEPEPLVDGGYAHNVPVEAVAKLGARQALILQSDAAPEDGQLGPTPEGLEARFGSVKETQWAGLFVGQLALNLPRLIPFLFNQAQSVDRISERNLLVVSVAAPADAEHAGWPALFDFRRAVVQRMLTTAGEDFDRRVARVDNWPPPGRHRGWESSGRGTR